LGASARRTCLELLSQHGSLPSTLAACCHEPPSNATAAFLAVIYGTLRSITRRRLLTGPIVSTSDAAIDYLMLEMAHLPIEHVRALFLSTGNRLIADETMMRGTIDNAPIYPRDILKRALELNAASIIAAHNHPSGDPTPSHQDLAATRQLVAAGAALNVAVLDHLILASSGWISLRTEGLIEWPR
jgi:DNA repair protein RadC